MKKAVLLLWLVGAAVYTVDTLTVPRPYSHTGKTQVSAQPETRPPASNQPDQPLRSWGPFLPGHRPDQHAAPPALPKFGTLQPSQDLAADIGQQPNRDIAEPSLNGNDGTDASSEFIEAEWVKVILAAK